MKSKLFRLFALLMVASMVFTSVVPASAQSGVSGYVSDDAVTTQPETPTTSPAKIGVSETGLYIVRLQDPALASYKGEIPGLEATSPSVTGARKLDVNAEASRAYASYLEGKQNEFVTEVEKTLGHPVEVAFRYVNVLNGMAVRVSQEEAIRLAGLPSVKAVYPDTLRDMDTDVGPWWIKADSIWNGDIGSGVDTKGEGVLIGMIDSGVNHAHPSFADIGGDGYDHTNPWGAGNYHGVCNPSDPNYIAGFCNDKLISAFNFYPGLVSPEDLDGHGSHTGSTAGGNTHVMTLTVGTSVFTRTISGVAPHANLAIYKVCSPSCPDSASVAAANQGITDGVDVINYSISGGDDPWNDPVDMAFLDAFNAGVFVSTSAGNSGPGASTVAHTGPWNATVANSTLPRLVANSLDVTNPFTSTLQDVGALQGNGPNLAADLTAEIADYPANPIGCTATGGIPAGTFTGKIAVLARGTCNFTEKVTNATNAGAIALVIYNNRGGPPISMSIGGTIPSLMTNLADGLALSAYIDAHAPVTVRINAAAAIVYNPDYANIVSNTSSRGPSTWELLKPDYAAPGTNILAAVAAEGGDPLQYAFYSGTSMASPHSAGSGALMTALHPTWSPAEIRSALQTATTPWSDIRADSGTAVTTAKPFDAGAGHLNLQTAANVGLVLDETYAHYVAADPHTGGDLKGLNQSSLVSYNCVGTCTWTRTVESVLPFQATYTVTWETTHPTLTVTASPAVFTINPGATQQIQFTAHVAGMPVDIFAFGDVVFETDAAFPGDMALSESFEGASFPPAGWTITTTGVISDPGWLQDDGSSADLDYGPITPADGSYFIWHNDDDTGDMNESWAVSPVFTPTAGMNLSFFQDNYFTPSYYYYHGVLVSTDSCNPADGDFVELQEFGTNVNGWTQETISLGAYAGQSICVAFEYAGDYTDEWLVDNVQVFEAGMPVSDQRLTTVVVPASAFVPGNVVIDTDQKAGSQLVEDLQAAAPVVTFTYGIDGLDQADITNEMVEQDPTAGSPYNGDGGVLVKYFPVPAGALRLVVEVIASSAQDVDMWVGTGATIGTGIVCTSATGAVLEHCELDNPTPGDYWAVAENFLSSTPGAEDLISLSVGVVMPGDSGNVVITGPNGVPAGQPFDITVHWNEPDFAGEQLWYGVATLGTSPANPDDLGQTNIKLAYHQPVYATKEAPAMALPGDVFPYTIVLNGQGSPIVESAHITDLLPAGVEFAGNLTSTFGTATYDAGDNAVYWDNGARRGLPETQNVTAAPRQVALTLESKTSETASVVPFAAPEAAVSMALDDGTVENNIGIGGTAEFIFVNRFTPAAAEFPFTLNQIQVYFSGGANLPLVGDNVLLVVYENTSANADPAVGSNLLGSFPATVQALNAWNVYTLATPVTFNGPGDVLIGVVPLKLPGSAYYPAAQDQTASQQRSWAGWWTTAQHPNLTLPPNDTWGLIDSFGATFAGNWMLRGYGETGGTPTPSVITITFDVSVTAALGDVITNTVNYEYAGDDFTAQAVTLVDSNEVTFMYHDLEDVVAVGEDVKLAGDFTNWGTNAIVMNHDAAYDVFTATLNLDPGTYGYKYIVVSGGDQWDWLNTSNRTITVTGDQEAHDYRNVTVGYAVLSDPAAITITLGSETGIITGQVYIQNVTNPAGMGDYHAQLGYGTGSDLDSWTWVDLTYAGQVGNNDVLTGTLLPADNGVYSYTVRFDGNWGASNPNQAWTYGDLDGVYPGEPFELGNTGVLTVVGSKLYLPLVFKQFGD